MIQSLICIISVSLDTNSSYTALVWLYLYMRFNHNVVAIRTQGTYKEQGTCASSSSAPALS